MDVPHDRDDQTELPEPIKISWTGRLRDRVNERNWDYVCNSGRDEDGEWIISDDADPYSVAAYRALSRLKTKVVIETAEEAYAVHGTLSHYTDPADVTWLNPRAAKSARRVQAEVRSSLDDLDRVEVERSGLTHINVEVDE